MLKKELQYLKFGEFLQLEQYKEVMFHRIIQLCKYENLLRKSVN